MCFDWRCGLIISDPERHGQPPKAIKRKTVRRWYRPRGYGVRSSSLPWQYGSVDSLDTAPQAVGRPSVAPESAGVVAVPALRCIWPLLMREGSAVQLVPAGAPVRQ